MTAAKVKVLIKQLRKGKDVPREALILQLVETVNYLQLLEAKLHHYANPNNWEDEYVWIGSYLPGYQLAEMALSGDDFEDDYERL